MDYMPVVMHGLIDNITWTMRNSQIHFWKYFKKPTSILKKVGLSVVVEILKCETLAYHGQCQ